MSVQVPFFMRLAVGRPLVKSHGVGEGVVEDSVVDLNQGLINLRERASLRAGEG